MSVVIRDETAYESSDLVVVCAWCKDLNVLKLDVRLGDVHTFARINGSLVVTRQRGDDTPYRQLPVSDGICEPCKAKMLAEAGK